MTNGDASLQQKLDRLKKSVVDRAQNAVVQLPLWPEPKRGAPNSFIRSALFAAIQGKDRQFIKEAVLASQDGITRGPFVFGAKSDGSGASTGAGSDGSTLTSAYHALSFCWSPEWP